MFDYVFPIRKMFNFLMITMDQNISPLLTNTNLRRTKETQDGGESFSEAYQSAAAEEDITITGTSIEELSRDVGFFFNSAIETLNNDNKKSALAASCIDPEQFRGAKAMAASILESVLNSDNYTYIDKKTQQAGGTANLALRRTLTEI